jgi:peroxiredoxin Q/BCP
VIEEGKQVPQFSLPADDGTTVTRDSLLGRNTVLYFYHKDDTSGCTKEACDFRDAFPRFGKTDAQVIGVRPDSIFAKSNMEKN